MVLPKKMIKAHALDKVHNNKRTQAERVVDSRTPSLDIWDGDSSILVDKTQHLNLHSNLLVRILVANVADDRKAEQPYGAVAKSHLLKNVVSAMNKGVFEVTRESIWMEGRHPLGEMAGYASGIHFINPKFRLNSVDVLISLVNIHCIVRGFEI